MFDNNVVVIVGCFKEYLMYKQFLEKLTPNEWKEEKLSKRREKLRLKREALVSLLCFFIVYIKIF